jgi:hypothetical protein
MLMAVPMSMKKTGARIWLRGVSSSIIFSFFLDPAISTPAMNEPIIGARARTFYLKLIFDNNFKGGRYIINKNPN